MKRHAFTLVELLVAISIISLLMMMVAAAASAAQSNRKVAATRATIAKLDLILTSQLSTYNSKDVSGTTAARGAAIRKMITADLPDRWTDVAYMKANVGQFTAAPQRAFIGTTPGSSQYAGAECLFMIIMQGGFVNCLDCGERRSIEKCDKDSDGAQEFWDAWGNPIDYILWPYAVELPPGSGARFFSGSRQPDLPGVSSSSPMLGLRPLIYSPGVDGEYGLERNGEAANLGGDCGNWQMSPTSTSAGPENSSNAADNISNFDQESKR